MIIDNIACPVCQHTGPKKLLRTVENYKVLACPVCSFQFIHPYVESRQAFDDYPWTKEYTENYDRYVAPVTESLAGKIKDVEALAGRRPASFLDVGCGNGLYLKAASELGLRNLGTDVDRVNVDFARGKGLNAVAGAIEEMELAEKYDFVHLKAVIHLVPDPSALVAKAASLLAPGGVMYIDVPNQGSLFSGLRILRDRRSYGQLQLPLRRGAYNFRALSDLCCRTGLIIVRRVFPYPGDSVYYPLDNRPQYRLLFRLFAKAHISSLIGVYLVKENVGEDRIVR
ncbi:MAG: class I SAM-dependent methyltransferase [Acidobacteriota bacterium]